MRRMGLSKSYENYEKRLKDREENPEYQAFLNRYRVLNPYRTFLMEWDVDCCIWYWDPKEETGLPNDYEDRVYLEPEKNWDDPPFVFVPGLADWVRAPMPAVCATPDGEDILFDWKTWNRQGIELATKLRELLPADYDIYYCAPFEDYTSWNMVPILIKKRG